jgi:Restriction endonuclease
MIVALECRDRGRKVGVPEIEAFKNKCDRTGVDKGVVVSSTGFTKTALLKSQMMGIDCFGLNEIERFDWCHAPGILSLVREIIEGPNFIVFPSTPVTTSPMLYDEEGQSVDTQQLRVIANNCLNNRTPEMASAQDTAAIDSPVGIRFIVPDPLAWHVLDVDNRRVSLVRLEISLRYQVHVSIIPFSFRKYIDYGAGKEIYAMAQASIGAGDVQGDILLHRVEGEYIEVVFVPRNTPMQTTITK